MHCSRRVGTDIIAARETISTIYVLFNLLENYSLRFLWGLTKSWTRLKYHEYIIFFQVEMEFKSLPISYEYLCFVIIVFFPHIWVRPACVVQVIGIACPSCKLKRFLVQQNSHWTFKQPLFNQITHPTILYLKRKLIYNPLFQIVFCFKTWFLCDQIFIYSAFQGTISRSLLGF